MGKLPDNYFGPKQRITMLKADYPGDKSAILTEVKMQQVGEALVILIKASIKVDDKVIAEGHAFTDTPDEDKAVEKAETVAIGRALVNAGYPETLDESPALDDKEDEAPKAKSKGLSGLGTKKKQEPKEEPKDESTDEDSDEAEEPAEEVKPAAKKSSGLSGLKGRTSSGGRPAAVAGLAKVDDANADDGDATDENSEDDEDSDSEEEVETEEKTAEAPAKKITREELLAKYRSKKPA